MIEKAYRSLACLLSTPHGWYLWTSHYHEGGHVFRPIKDNELWEWV